MPMFVRVKDNSTGHEFDVPETDPRIGTAFVMANQKRFPRSSQPRPPKHNPLPSTAPAAGGRAESETDQVEGDSEAPATETAAASAAADDKPARTSRGTTRK